MGSCRWKAPPNFGPDAKSTPALHVACIMGLASCRIVGRSIRERMKTDLVCQALQSAY